MKTPKPKNLSLMEQIIKNLDKLQVLDDLGWEMYDDERPDERLTWYDTPLWI